MKKYLSLQHAIHLSVLHSNFCLLLCQVCILRIALKLRSTHADDCGQLNISNATHANSEELFNPINLCQYWS